MGKFTITALLFATLIFSLIGCGDEATDEVSENGESTEIVTVSVNGSTTVAPIMTLVAEEYEASDLEVSGTGSGDGITALLDGRTDIAMASRPMKDKEWDMAKENGLDIVEVEIAKDGIAVCVHPSNTLSNLSLEQLHGIYAGEFTDWSQVGGIAGEIVVISRDSSSGTFEMFNKIVLGKNDAGEEIPLRNDSLTQKSNGDVHRTLVGAEGAIAYLGLGYLDDKVKAISVDGAEPTKTNVVSDTYAISRTLFLYHLADASDAVKAVVDYVLGEAGQALVVEASYIPLK